jgi:hypothetical protein
MTDITVTVTPESFSFLLSGAVLLFAAFVLLWDSAHFLMRDSKTGRSVRLEAVSQAQ